MYGSNLADNAVATAGWAASRMGARTDAAAARVRAAAQAVEDAVNASDYCAVRATAAASMADRIQYGLVCDGWEAGVLAALGALEADLEAVGDAAAAEVAGGSADALVGLGEQNEDLTDLPGMGEWWAAAPGWLRGLIALAGLYGAAKIVGAFRGR